MKNRFIMLAVILLSPLIYKSIISDQTTLEDIEYSAEHGVNVAVEKSVPFEVDVSKNHLFHAAAGANIKKRNVSKNTSNRAANMASDKANETGNEEVDLDGSKVDSDKSLAVTSSWFGTPEDAEYHYINLFIESEMLSCQRHSKTDPL